MPETVKVYAVLCANDGRAEELRALLRWMVAPSRAEEGNLRYDLWQDIAKPGRFVLEGLYRDQAAAAAHKDSVHFRHYAPRISDVAMHTVIPVIALDVGKSDEELPAIASDL
ncbi:antibiotic biosynthesis monooxygenase [Rhizobiaceae bacterium n13]|uniref:putative quinol monooxygenase n=1 Tax=Ferirhizobium litorale TaxID=2927786 RepID=UPI0024B2E2D9|nr:putative quinol monooxygenase [Fererhizobium litorale]MDI7862850.1 antibiotic biosynthesis monooxygenase [Fererhizobium litorale]